MRCAHGLLDLAVSYNTHRFQIKLAEQFALSQFVYWLLVDQFSEEGKRLTYKTIYGLRIIDQHSAFLPYAGRIKGGRLWQSRWASARGGERAFAPLEIGTMNQNVLENLKSTA